MSRIVKMLLIVAFTLGLMAFGCQKKAETQKPATKTEKVAKADTTQHDTTAAKTDTTQKAAEQK